MKSTTNDGACDDGGLVASRRPGDEVQRVFDILRQEIVSGVLPPAAKLNENEISRRLGISRGPLREAIRRLQERELVLCIPNAGARVNVHSPQDIVDTFDVRAGLEGVAARLAARNMSVTDLQTLASFVDSDSFHVELAKRSGNKRLIQILNASYFDLVAKWRLEYSWFNVGSAASLREHRRIFEALEARDADVAELLMRRHVAGLRSKAISRFQEAGVLERSERDVSAIVIAGN
jgi:DNA-binding GntR family transcriptional regulator